MNIVTKDNLGSDFILDIPNNKIYSNQVVYGTGIPVNSPSILNKYWFYFDYTTNQITYFWDLIQWKLIDNIIDAQNGLTKVGDKVELGGTLLHDTTIDMNNKYLAFFGKEFFISDTWGKTNYTHSGISFKSTFYNTSNPNNDWGMGFVQSVFGKNFKIDPITDRPLIEQTWSNNPSFATSGYCINLGTDLSNNADGIQIWGGKGLLNSPLELLMQISPIGNVGIGVPFHTFPSEKLEVNGNIKGDTAKFFSYVTLSDPQTKNIKNSISFEQSRKFINIFPDAIEFTYKDEFIPEELKEKSFIGFDSKEVEKVQLENSDIFPSFIVKNKVQEFDIYKSRFNAINESKFIEKNEHKENIDLKERDLSDFQTKKEREILSYNIELEKHNLYREKYDGLNYLDLVSIIPMLLMDLKRQSIELDKLTERLNILEGSKIEQKINHKL